MKRSTIHIAPALPRPSRDVHAPAVISVTALAGVSAMVRHAFGDKVLRLAKQAAKLDIERIEDQECFIPQTTMIRFLNEIERRSGEPHLGLLIAPHLSLGRYGRWGEYVLSGETLGAAIARAASTLGYHSTGDRMDYAADRGVARVSYYNATRGQAGYAQVSSATAGVLVSLLRAYLGADLQLRTVELDIPAPRAATLFEDTFSCPVVFDAPAVSVSFAEHLFDRPLGAGAPSRWLTFEDVARARVRTEPADLGSLLGVLSEQIRAQVLAGAVSIDSAARGIGISVRSLQRSLQREGADFRQLVNLIRAQRAKELLGESAASITEIATAFGYSSPANFARAFRKATGKTPQEFRATRRR